MDLLFIVGAVLMLCPFWVLWCLLCGVIVCADKASERSPKAAPKSTDKLREEMRQQGWM